MNPDEVRRVTTDWLGRPMHMTPNVYRIMREMSGIPEKPRKGFRQVPRHRKQNRRTK